MGFGGRVIGLNGRILCQQEVHLIAQLFVSLSFGIRERWEQSGTIQTARLIGDHSFRITNEQIGQQLTLIDRQLRILDFVPQIGGGFGQIRPIALVPDASTNFFKCAHEEDLIAAFVTEINAKTEVDECPLTAGNPQHPPTR